MNGILVLWLISMNLITYIEKYGNKTFEEKELNGVDKLIFSNLSYVHNNIFNHYNEAIDNKALKYPYKYRKHQVVRYYGK